MLAGVAHGVGPTSSRSWPGTLGYEIKELILRFPPVAAFGEYWLVAYINHRNNLPWFYLTWLKKI